MEVSKAHYLADEHTNLVSALTAMNIYFSQRCTESHI